MKADVFENEFLQSQLIDYLHQVDGDKIDMRSGISVMLMLAAILREQGAISYSEIGHSMELIANLKLRVLICTDRLIRRIAFIATQKSLFNSRHIKFIFF